MKRYDLQVIVNGVLINYAFSDPIKRSNYLNEILTKKVAIEYSIANIDVFEKELLR